MAIITKPVGGIVKGVSASISLSKSELSALSIIVADSYFSNTSNWNKVILKYRSSTGKQYEVVQFDATLSSPTGNFLVSIKARNAFEIQTIEIHDFDNDIFIVPRSALTTADFDIVLLTAPSSLSYSTPVTYTQNTAITNNVPTVTGTVTSYSISPALPAGLNFNTTTGVISGTPTEASAAANYVVTASNGAGSTTATINITVESSIPENIVTFTGRNSTTYISFPAPGSVTRLLPAVNLAGNGQGSFWSTTPLTGDFTFTATVKAGSVSDGAVQALFGLNDVMPPPSNSGYGLKAAGWGLNFYNAGSIVKPWDVTSNTLSYTKGSTYNIEIKRVSGVVSYKVNSTTFSYTLSTSATVYLVGYLQLGSWEVTNAQLVVPEEFTGGAIPWNNTSSGYLFEPDGGVTTTAQRPSGPLYDIVYSSSSSYMTGDFTYEAEISTSLQSDSIVGFYNSITTPIYNTIVKGGATTLSFWLTNNWNSGTPEYTVAKPSGDTFLFKITRVGTLVKLFVNNVEIASETTIVSHLLVPVFSLRPNDYIVSASLILPATTDYITYELNTAGATLNATGGVSGGSAIDDVFIKDSSGASGDFAYEWKFNWSSINPVNVLFGVTGTYGSGLWYDKLTCLEGTNSTNPEKARLWVNGTPNVLTNITIPDGDNVYKLTRSGTIISHYLNGSLIYSSSVPLFTAYPTVRTKGLSACIESYIP